MSYLIDTHAFLFAAFGSSRLSRTAADLLSDPDNEVFISVVSFWEISLKAALGKLELKGVAASELPAVAAGMGLSVRDLTASEASTLGSLPPTDHKDPFDRMLIWQALCGGLVLISRDNEFRRYVRFGLRTAW